MKYKFTKREIRLLVLVSIAMAIFGYIKRPWFYSLKLESPRYICYSTATEEQTQKILDIAEALFESYAGFFNDQSLDTSYKFKLKLYKDRDEFKSYNLLTGWAEAFYRKPYCHQYYSEEEDNPYHWMIHEATHQLNAEAAGFKLEKWLEEGVATYLGTSTYRDGQLITGTIDTDTYPIWWLREIELSGDIDADIEAGKIIPLKNIITNKGGPDIDDFFNLYYIHWWSLTHFLIHHNDGQYRDGFYDLVEAGGTLEAFEKHIAPIETVQAQWYEYLQKITDDLW